MPPCRSSTGSCPCSPSSGPSWSASATRSWPSTGGGDGAPATVAERPPESDGGDEPPIADDLRLTRLRMQGLIDQMAAGVARIDALGLTLRDIEHGLVDFPALVSGRQVWLCWQLRRARRSAGGTPRHRVLRTAAAGRADMTERSVVVGRDGRAKAYRPLPEAERRRPSTAGLAAYRARRLLRGPRGCSSRPGWARTTRPSGRCSRA